VTSRRQLLKGVAASTAASGLWSLWPARVDALGTSLPVELFVFDRRFAAARAAARAIGAGDVRATGIDGDLTRLWYDSLDLRWKRAPMTLAGMTTRAGLFVLETLAADRGMRVLYRGEHEPARVGHIAHALVGPTDLLVEMATENGASWPIAVGNALARLPAAGSRHRHLVSTPADAEDVARAEALWSWVIAPRSVVREPV
jgi:hypothetical protein